MGCETVGAVTVCSGPRGVVRRRYLRCWNCETKRRVVEVFSGSWYPSTFYCCYCGDGWGGGYRMVRPFTRGWRQRAAERAKRYWRDALTPEAFAAAVEADLRPYIRHTEDTVSDL
jgi:hypothetical protein